MKDDELNLNGNAVVWTLADWRYWPDTGKLQQGKQRQQLTHQQNQVLTLLLDSAPAVVSREHFLEQVWVGKIVNEDALSRTIAELRKALGDSAAQARYIKTIPKKGYQLNVRPEPWLERQRRQWLRVAAVSLLLLAGGLSWWSLFQQPLTGRLVNAVANASRITADPGMEQHSTLSADGQWLSYVNNSSAGHQIVIRSLTDTNLQHTIELPRHRLASPVQLSADERIFFTARDQSSCYLKSYHPETRAFTDWGGCVFNGESRLLNGHEPSGLLLYSAKTAEQRVAIFQLDPQSAERQQISWPSNISEQDWSAQLSPDGQRLSFSRGNQSVRNLWVRDLQLGKSYQVTSGEHYSVSHQWLDDEHIIYDSDENGSRQLWLLNVNDLSATALGGDGAQHPAFDQQRSMMSFQKVSYEANIWLQDFRTGELKRVIHSNKYDNYPAFAPDGSSFVFSSNRQDLGSIWKYDLTSGNEYLLLSIPGAKLTRPAWADDGQAVLMTVNDDSGYWTLRYDLSSGSHQRLPFTHANHSPMSHQGDWYALASDGELNQRVLTWDAGTQHGLPMKNISRFRVLDDGRVVYTHTNQDGLFIFDSRNQQSDVLLADFPAASLNLWTTVNQAVYFDRGGVRAGTWKLDITSGHLSQVTSNRAYSVGVSMAVDRAEQQMLLVRTDRAESDVFLANLKEPLKRVH